MDDLQRMAAERSCEALIARYAHVIDDGHASQVADLFTADGVWESPESTLVGRDAIRTAFLRREQSGRRSRHVCTNVAVDVVDESNATGICYLVLFRTDAPDDGSPARGTQPALVGVYRDSFARDPEGWRFRHRVTEVAFLAGRGASA